ncbi:galactosylgalactosylxylosylprotein 3-beta-glucuronosyltransferase P isoform X3 [Drosophila elegans]|uniref:galactosylgalactosylxylosylprotein 3-beta-glucuronosyltransferase P isoform X3 n=1 Tax=Drosophila elegans TaxID=30023 RepID=UPI001BC84BB2|nr:galactosylgalactosylxylosylprotein 3-beta-glucuronosyltransferase P isoform X3 [Drosophila elegans]
MKGNYINLSTHSGINGASGNGNGNGKMSLGKSIKMYLTIFIATTCIYMVLYQYHISREPFAAAEVVKHQEKSSSYIASYLWSPISLLMANSSSNINTKSTTTSTTIAPITRTTTTTTTTAGTVGSVGQKVGGASSASIRMVSLAATEATFISSSSELRSGLGSESGSVGGYQKTATTKTSTTTRTTTTTTATAGVLATTIKLTTTTKAKTSAKTSAVATPTASHSENGQKTRPTFVAASEPVNILT